MKLKNVLIVLGLLLPLGLLTQCEKYGKPGGGMGVPDPDSDRPAWAGGNTIENPHNKKDSGGTTGGSGGDYGDLNVISRDADGVPDIVTMVVDEKTIYLYQPLDAAGNELEYNEEGVLVNPELVVPVDFGRLDIVRSPQSVLDQAFGEALKVLKANGAVITLDFCGRLTSTYTDPLTGDIIAKTIDSPRENMAIYQYIMKNLFVDPLKDGTLNKLAFLGEAPYNFNALDIAASCFAAGSDKTGEIDIDEVVYINGFIECLGLNPIENEYDYDHDNNLKKYFNYTNLYGTGDGNMYQYNRDVYKTRFIQYLNWYDSELGVTVHYEPGDPTNADERTFSIFRVMEGSGPDETPKFRFRWPTEPYIYQVEGFAIAADDAVQVLEYLHGDSDIIYLPDY